MKTELNYLTMNKRVHEGGAGNLDEGFGNSSDSEHSDDEVKRKHESNESSPTISSLDINNELIITD